MGPPVGSMSASLEQAGGGTATIDRQISLPCVAFFLPHRSFRFSMARRSILLSLLGWWLLQLAGCRALPWRCPSDDRVIAAREQGRLGTDSLVKGRLNEAQVRFEHALDRCPHDCQIRHDLATVYWKQGKRQEAIEAQTEAIRASGDKPAWVVELGDMLLATGNVAAALQAADHAIQVDSSLGEAWRLRGDIVKRQGNLEQAISNYHRAVSGGADESHVLLELADIYRVQNRPRRALATLNRLADNVPAEAQPPRMDYLKAIAYQALGRHDEAIPHFEQALRIEEQNPEIQFLLARSQWEAGHADAARHFAELAARQMPGDVNIRRFIAETSRESSRIAGRIDPLMTQQR